MTKLFAALTAAILAPGMALADVPVNTSGDALTDSKGMTLYIFDKDSAGTSACYDKCAVNWPPLMVEGDAMAEGEFTIVERTDGTKQWAYKGMPLYL